MKKSKSKKRKSAAKKRISKTYKMNPEDKAYMDRSDACCQSFSKYKKKYIKNIQGFSQFEIRFQNCSRLITILGEKHSPTPNMHPGPILEVLGYIQERLKNSSGIVKIFLETSPSQSKVVYHSYNINTIKMEAIRHENIDIRSINANVDDFREISNIVFHNIFVENRKPEHIMGILDRLTQTMGIINRLVTLDGKYTLAQQYEQEHLEMLQTLNQRLLVDLETIRKAYTAIVKIYNETIAAHNVMCQLRKIKCSASKPLLRDLAGKDQEFGKIMHGIFILYAKMTDNYILMQLLNKDVVADHIILLIGEQHLVSFLFPVLSQLCQTIYHSNPDENGITNISESYF